MVGVILFLKVFAKLYCNYKILCGIILCAKLKFNEKFQGENYAKKEVCLFI